MTIIALQKMIYKKIPLTRQMGLRVIKSTSRSVVFQLDLNKNINHVGTIFGGSTSAAQAVACWGVYLNLLDSEGLHPNNYRFVLKKSQCEYSRPLVRGAQVIAYAPPAKKKGEVLKKLKKGQKVRLVITASAVDKNEDLRNKSAVSFKGEFVIFGRK